MANLNPKKSFKTVFHEDVSLDLKKTQEDENNSVFSKYLPKDSLFQANQSMQNNSRAFGIDLRNVNKSTTNDSLKPNPFLPPNLKPDVKSQVKQEVKEEAKREIKKIVRPDSKPISTKDVTIF
jgi:hypothetical protein